VLLTASQRDVLGVTGLLPLGLFMKGYKKTQPRFFHWKHVLTPTTFNSIRFLGAPYSLPKRRFWGYWGFAIRPFHEMLQNTSNMVFPLKTNTNNIQFNPYLSVQTAKQGFLGVLLTASQRDVFGDTGLLPLVLFMKCYQTPQTRFFIWKHMF